MIALVLNSFAVKLVKANGSIITWKTLSKVDRLNLSDTDERAKVMPRLRIIIIGVQIILLKRIDNRTENRLG